MASVEKLPSGKWRATAYLGRDVSGKKIRKTFTAETKWQALKLAEEYKETREERPKGMTVGDAIDGYIAAKTNVLSPTSISSYKGIRRNRLQSLMDVPLNKLTVLTVQKAVNADAARLSAKSVISAHGLLSSALKMYAPDFVLRTTLPAKQPHIKQLPEPEVVYDAIAGTEIELPCMLAMWLSLRMSEIRGLQYRDIGTDELLVRRTRVYVEGKQVCKEQTKTFSSTRVCDLPQYIRDLIYADGEEHQPEEFIVNLSGQAIYKRFVRIMKKHDVKMTFHDLRHLNASIMLALGVPDKYAMERGGWSTNSTLKAVYQHTFSDERKKVNERINNYFSEVVHTKVHKKNKK